jgi:hypothetical protein
MPPPTTTTCLLTMCFFMELLSLKRLKSEGHATHRMCVA